jgi:hypothetical protein
MNLFKKIALKLKDPEEYKNYKFNEVLAKVNPPNLGSNINTEIHFKHSGNAGDIIYAIPVMQALAGVKPIHLYLNINQKGVYGKKTHPLGSVMLNEKMVLFLKELLIAQPQIKVCEVYTNQRIDYDLDLIRQYPLQLNRGHISRWYFLCFAAFKSLAQPWLEIPNPLTKNNSILIARSFRYNSPGIDYSFLNKYPNLCFVGVQEEFDVMKKVLPNLEYLPVTNALQLAIHINNCKFFIGNQSFPFSIAEALKVKRILEVYHQSPNVIIEGANGYDFCFQPQFEKLVADLYNQ